jgi:hypothetical protein
MRTLCITINNDNIIFYIHSPLFSLVPHNKQEKMRSFFSLVVVVVCLPLLGVSARLKGGHGNPVCIYIYIDCVVLPHAIHRADRNPTLHQPPPPQDAESL